MLINNNIIIDYDFIGLDKKPFQVMMSWEKPYMEKCVEFLKPHGDVLEIGFGLGYSATAINKYRLNSYTVIEKDKDVIKNFNKWKLKQKNKKINVIKGMWQHVLPFLNKKYDCIFFDDSPNVKYGGRLNLFIKLILLKNIKYNTKLVAYSSVREKYSGFLTKHFTYQSYKYKIKVPYYCRYAKGEYMYINKFIFKKK